MKKKESKYIKVGAVSPKIRLGDVDYNVKACIKEAKRAAEMGVKILAFPALTLTGATCGDMFRQETLCKRAELGLAEFVEATAELDMMSFIGLPALVDGEVYKTTAVVYKGEIFALVPANDLDYREVAHFDPPGRETDGLTFAGRNTSLVIYPVFPTPFDKSIKVEICADYLDKNATVVICPSADEE